MTDDDEKTQVSFNRPRLGEQPARPPRPAAAGSPPAPGPPPRAARRREAEPASLAELAAVSNNRLVACASPLLMLAAQLRHTTSRPDVSALRSRSVSQVHEFEQGATAAGYSPQQISAARYALCTLLDESVMNTPWGASAGWSSQSLLLKFHGETWGGEKFFQIVDRLKQDPEQFHELIELLYHCISLGLVGRFGAEAGGGAKLAEIRDQLYRIVVARRGTVDDATLSPHWRGLQDQRNAFVRVIPLWVVGMISLALVIISFLIFNRLLGARSAPITGQLAQVGLEPYVPERAALQRPQRGAPVAPSRPPPPRLPELLVGPESRGAIAVETDGPKTIVVVSHPTLFASARAEINPEHLPLLAELAQALERVPGRILVVGHTDDLPLRSLAHKDNYELSRERARSVTGILSQGVSNPSRMEFTGVGPSQPRFLPANQPANRARNRRVEILHWAQD